MMLRAILFALLASLCAVSITRADDPITLADYRRVLDQVVQLVSQSQGAALDQRPELLKQAANLLGGVRQVQLDSGEPITVHNDKLISELNKTAEDSQHLYISTTLSPRLAALRAAMAAPPTSASDSDLEKLHEIFNQPPFKQSEAESWLRQLVRRFNQWLSSLFRGADDAIFNPDLITIGGILATILVVIIFVVNLRQNLAAEAELKTAEGTETITTSRSALSNAQRFAAAGDYRLAVRMLYLATLLILDERGRLRYDKSLTNREYLRAVKDEPAVANALRPIIETFDKTWYGFEDVTSEQFGEYEKRVAETKNL